MNKDKQIWKSVTGYEGHYIISTNGIIKSINRVINTNNGFRIIQGKILKTRINSDGYVEVRLTKKGKTTTTFIHILLAKAFIPNPFNKPEVNHINGNKKDNRVENLEWCTRLENMQHANRTGLIKRTYKQVIDKCTGRTYISSYEAALDLNMEYSTLKNYLNGNRTNKTCLEYFN